MRANRRDDCERSIILALEMAGASVTPLAHITGLPDLLVGLRGVTYLFECKDSHEREGKGRKRSVDGLRDSQRAWFAQWRGRPVVVVTTPEEALIAVGAMLAPAASVAAP